MLRRIFNDAYAEALSVISIASTPFITMGFFLPKVIAPAAVIGIAALIAMIVRMCYVMKTGKSISESKAISSLMNQLSLPYCIALCSLILSNNGINASIGMWFALGLTVLCIGEVMIPKHCYHL